MFKLQEGSVWLGLGACLGLFIGSKGWAPRALGPEEFPGEEPFQGKSYWGAELELSLSPKSQGCKKRSKQTNKQTIIC